tara:strand:- start:671 stop:1264 length:594 start_codon:yes stop_codon:yes gene_type:complete
MFTVAITGGIASGKTTVCHALAKALEAPLLSCDAVVHELYGDSVVLESVAAEFGNEIIAENGKLNRQFLGDRVFSNPGRRKWLEDLLHPLVLEKVNSWRHLQIGRCVLIEVPLLYEVDFPLKRDIDVVVACSTGTQLSRLQQRDQLDPDQALARIEAQLPIAEKMRRANVVIWNEGSPHALSRQTRLAASRISLMFP